MDSYAITSQPEYVQPQASSYTPARNNPKSIQENDKESDKYAAKLVQSGIEYHNQGMYDKALKEFQRALKSQMLSLGEEHPSIAQTLANIGTVYLRQGRIFLAWEALEEALQLKTAFREKCKNDGEQSKIYLADILNNLGNVAYLRGEHNLSLTYYRRALAEIREQNGPIKELASALHNIGRLNVINGEWDTALSFLSQCLLVEEKLYGEDDPAITETAELIGFVHLSTGDYDSAMICFSRTLSIFQRTYGAVNENIASALVNIGMVLEEQGLLHDALKSYRTARDVFRKVEVGEASHSAKAAYRSVLKIKRELQVIEQREQEYDRSGFIPIGEDKEETRDELHTASSEI